MQLSATARVILGMLRLGARSGYEIRQQTQISTRFFWGASYGQIYPELKRLEKAGLVEAEDDYNGARRRRLFRLTPAGERALRDWLRSDETLEFSSRDEGLLKLFFGSAVDPDDVLATVRRRIQTDEEALGFFRTIKASGYPAHALDYGVAFLEFDLAWWRGIEKRIARSRA